MSGDVRSSRGRKTPRDETLYAPVMLDVAADALLLAHDSLPALHTDSQASVIVIDSQGVATSELGPGALRDLQSKAERAALVADALAALKEARRDEAAAAEAVAKALAVQTARKNRRIESEALYFDMAGKHA